MLISNSKHFIIGKELKRLFLITQKYTFYLIDIDTFFIRLEKRVTHDDRDVEIILFKRQVQQYLEQKYGRTGELGSKSCEMIAEELLKYFDCETAEVLEDKENGAKVYK